MHNVETTTRVLLIDDDQSLAGMLREFLQPERIELVAAASGEAGLDKLATDTFDMVILDIMLPGQNGLDVLRTLRQTSNLPVIMLTARGDDIDRIIGLEFGADDYLAKPFNPRELAARLKAIMRRSRGATETTGKYRLDDIELDYRTRRATVRGTPMALTGTELEILGCLLKTPGQVVNKEELSERALGRRLLPYDRSIDTHMSNLRRKLERAGGGKTTIRNQRGIGYALVPGNRE
ncbi:MAG: response regulator transcription factor [Woeseiaceae bacterium]|nr:response regulator transcription factor [Woeseiaceae bacterium]